MKRVIFALGLSLVAQVATGQTVYSGSCAGAFAGVRMEGGLKVEYWPLSDTYQHHAVFFDANGNRYDVEVVSNQNGGVGGAWQNGARHREMHIEMRYQGKRLAIRELNGPRSGAFTCQ